MTFNAGTLPPATLSVSDVTALLGVAGDVPIAGFAAFYDDVVFTAQ